MQVGIFHANPLGQGVPGSLFCRVACKGIGHLLCDASCIPERRCRGHEGF
jgi:hypothetical protein